MRRLTRKPSLREQLQRNNAADRYYAAMAGVEPKAQAVIAPKREIVNRSAPEDLEAAVMREVKELLAVHPNVLFAVRQNSGGASYEAKSGKYAPIMFYQIVRAPVRMTITDWWGIMRDGRPMALECKRRGWVYRDSDKRAQEQAAFIGMILACGGRAGFCRSAAEAKAILDG